MCVVCMLDPSTEVQREAAQQQGVADAAKEVLRNQLSGLMKDGEMQRQHTQVRLGAALGAESQPWTGQLKAVVLVWPMGCSGWA